MTYRTCMYMRLYTNIIFYFKTRLKKERQHINIHISYILLKMMIFELLVRRRPTFCVSFVFFFAFFFFNVIIEAGNDFKCKVNWDGREEIEVNKL